MTSLRIKSSIFINFFLFAILLNSVGAVILQVQRYFAVSASSAAVLEIFKDLSLAAASFALVSFIVRIGYKRSMLIALAVMMLTCLAIPSLKSFAALKILFALTGACFALMKISVFGGIGLITRNEKEHLSMMNFIESFFMLGILGGYFVFSKFINDADAGSPVWFNVYYVLAAFAGLAFMLLLFTPLDESAAKRQEPVPGGQGLGAALKMLLMPMILVFVGSIFLYTLIEQSIMCWLPTFNNKEMQISSSLSIQVAGILALSIAAGRLMAGFIIKRINWFTILITCLLAISVLVIVTLPFTGQYAGKQISSWSAVPAAAYIFPLVGFFLAPVYPVINSVILSSLPAGKQAMMAGLIILFSSAGGMTGSVITGLLFQSLGGKAAFYFSLVPLTILIGILFRYKRRSDREQEAGRYTPLQVVLA